MPGAVTVAVFHARCEYAPVNLREIARLRLRNQRVSGAHLNSAEAVVAWLGCVQSQEYAVAKWSLAQRASGFSDSDVDQVLVERNILRTQTKSDPAADQ